MGEFFSHGLPCGILLGHASHYRNDKVRIGALENFGGAYVALSAALGIISYAAGIEQNEVGILFTFALFIAESS